MPDYFCVSIRFLAPTPSFHGRRDGGEPEWPPSPLRLFQALVAAAANYWPGAQFEEYAKPALGWLEGLPAPEVIAPDVRVGVPFRIAVPNNDLDVVATAWSKGNEPKKQPSELKTMKTVRPTHLKGEAVHYLFPLAESDAEFDKHRPTLAAAARSITHVGWGVDMVAADATILTEEAAARLPGERWRPTEGSSANGLRVPQDGTLKNLAEKHTAFLTRLSDDGFRPVPPLTAYRVVGYARPSDAPARPWAAFRILSADPDRPNPSFDTPRRCRDVAAWVRHVVAGVCDGWPFGDIDRFVHGHDADGTQLRGEGADDRFMYLPLPTINPTLRRVESIRRVLIAAPPGCEAQIEWLRQRLPGQELVADDGRATVTGVLAGLSASDWVLGQYVRPAAVWSTVTPVVMHGHEDRGGMRSRLAATRSAEVQRRLLDHLERRGRELLRRAFREAGFPPELVDGAEFEWQAVGFRAGVDLARRYVLPEPSGRLPTYHVRVRFPVPVRGPIAVGAGRYRGFGVFAAEA